MRRSLQQSVLLLGLLLLFVGQSAAQTSISFNETVMGEITTAPLSYTFVGEANQQITLEILSVTDGFTPAYLLLDAANAVIAQGQPPAGQFNIEQGVALTTSGTYTLIITAGTTQLGEFALRITDGSPQEQPVLSGEGDACEVLTTESLLQTVEEICTNVGRNQICYGNRSLSAVPNPSNFVLPGDTANIADILSLELAPLNVANSEWGVALLQVQANLPDTLPGQNVTILVFGGVSLSANPQEDADAPLQSFYFTGGIGETDCRETPTEGILIESPEDAGVVELVINGVNLQIASTVFVGIDRTQATPRLEFNTIEGLVVVESGGVSQTIPTGQRTSLQINENGDPIAPPEAPQAIDESRIPLAVRVIIDVERQPIPIRTPIPTVIVPSVATATLLPSATPTQGIVQPILPTSGVCVLATLDPVFVNSRLGPSTDFGITGQLNPEDVYTVIGRTRDNSWYETSQGWSAGFVTRRGGDCSNVRITYTAPTATPQYQIAGANNYTVAIDATILGSQQNLSGQLSFPQGIASDRVVMRVINNTDTKLVGGRSVAINIQCSGVGSNAARVLINGQSASCDQQGYYFAQAVSVNSTTIDIALQTFAPQGAYVTWLMNISVVQSR